MTFAFGLFTAGLIIAVAAAKNTSVANVLSGSIQSGASAFNLRKGGNDTEPAEPSDVPTTKAGTSTPKSSWNPSGKPIALWIVPLLSCAAKNGWKGQVNSGYRTKAEQTAIWNSGVRPAAKPGTSNHEKMVYPGGAVDVTDHAGLQAALKKCPGGSLLKWYGPGDEVHFSGTGR